MSTGMNEGPFNETATPRFIHVSCVAENGENQSYAPENAKRTKEGFYTPESYGRAVEYGAWHTNRERQTKDPGTRLPQKGDMIMVSKQPKSGEGMLTLTLWTWTRKKNLSLVEEIASSLSVSSSRQHVWRRRTNVWLRKRLTAHGPVRSIIEGLPSDPQRTTETNEVSANQPVFESYSFAALSSTTSGINCRFKPL